MTSKTLSITVLTTASLLFNARADITTGLVASWNFSDGPGSSTVVDASGNGNTGTLTSFTDATYNNMWTTTTDPTNALAYALNFNAGSPVTGTDAYVSIPDSTSIELATANKAWTLAAWVNCSVGGASEPANAGIIAKGNLNAEAFALYMSGGKFTTMFHNAADSGTENVSSTTIPTAGVWYHVVATVMEPLGSSNAEAVVYVNGVRESPANANTYTTVYSTNLPVVIGCRANATGVFNLPFQGIIDNVRIYDRALSGNDVFQLYTNYYFPSNSGIGYWNGLAGSGGNATLDTTSLNFCTNLWTAPVGTADTLPDLLNVEFTSVPSEPNACFFYDSYFNSKIPMKVQNTNLSIATGGVAIGNANGAGTVNFLNSAVTYNLNSTDNNGLKDGVDPTSLVRSGGGTVVLTGNNTFSGGTFINSGTVQIGNGSGGATTGSPLSTGAVTDNGSLVFNANDTPPAFNNTISGSGSVTQKGSGTLTLGGANAYTGGTILAGGILSVNTIADSGTSAIGNSGTFTLSGGTLAYTGGTTTTARTFSGTTGTTTTIDVPNGVSLELSGRVTGTAAWTVNKIDTGTLILSGTGDNSFLGMNVNAGTVILNKTSGTGHAIGNPLIVASGATVQLAGNGYTSEIYSNASAPVTINSGGLFDLNGQSDSFGVLNLSGTGISGSGAMINSANGTTSILTCSPALLAPTTIGGSGSPGNILLPTGITGTGMSLTYAGTGILALNGVNTYTGGTINNSTGSIYVGNGTPGGAGSILGNLTINSGGLELDNSSSLTSIATLTLAGSLSASAVNLNYSGSMNIGVLIVGGTAMPPGTYGASASNPNNVFQGAGILNVTGDAYWDANGTHASPGGGGTGNWNTGTSDWWLSGNSDTTWPTDALAFFEGTAGTVTLASSLNADALTFTTAGYIINNTDGTSVLTLDGSTPTITVPAGTTTIGCTIAESGANAVAVNGPGTLTLSGANTYAGGTTINGATLVANTIADASSSIGPSGTLTLEGAAELSYTGAGAASTTRTVTATGGTVNDIDLPAGNLTLNGSVTCSTSATFSKTSSGTLTLGGSTDNSALAMAINGGTVIITKTTTSTVHGLGGGTSSVASGAKLQLAGSGGFDLFTGCILTVNSGGVFDLNGQSDNMSTLTLSGNGSGSGVLINSSSTTSTLTNGGSGVVLAAPVTIGGSGNITLASLISGSGMSLTYAGTGTLALTNANTYSGGTTINSGGTVLLTNSATAAGTGAITVNPDSFLGVGITGNNATLNNQISGSGTINILETSANNLQLGGSMSGFTGTINCPASASVAKCQILTTGVGLPSAATINVAAGGTLYIANSVIIPGPVNLGGAGNSEVYGALRIETNAVVSGPVTLGGNTTIGNGAAAGNVGTISGAIGDGGHGYGITKTATPGTIVFSGLNTYTGPTTINSSTLTIGGAGDLGNSGGSGSYATNIVIASGAIFNYASSAAQTVLGTISGAGTLSASGPGPLTLTGTNSYTGPTTNAAGSLLTLSGGGCLGVTATTTNYPGAITNNGAINFNTSAPQTLSGVIYGTGTLTQSGPGALILTGADVYTGNTTISAGTLTLGGGGTINNTPSISIAAGATLDVSAYASFTLSSSTTTLSASGTGTSVGSTAATIIGASAGTVSLGSHALALTFTPQTFTGDITHPALYASQGALTLGGNAITVNNAAATPLGVGTYTLIQVAGGILNVSATLSGVTGTGLAPGTAASLSVSGGSLNLVIVTSAVPVPVINNVTASGTSLIFSGTNGPVNGTYHVLTSTDVTLPLNQWTSIANGSFSGTGTFSVNQPVSVSPSYFVIVIP